MLIFLSLFPLLQTQNPAFSVSRPSNPYPVPQTAGNPIQLWYGPVQKFGNPGIAQRWINVLGNVSEPEKIESVTFSINGNPPKPVSLGSDLHRLALPGDFNIELSWNEVNSGENQLLITAWPMDRPAISKEVTLLVEKRKIWPLPYRVDFSSINNLQEVVQVVDGNWKLISDGVRTVDRYYDRVLAMGDPSWADYEAQILLTIHAFTPPEPGPPTYNVTHFGVAMRWRGHHSDGLQPSRRWFPLGAQGEFLLKNNLEECRWRILFDGNTYKKPPRYSDKRNTLSLGVPIRIKTQVATLPGGRSRYRFKQWTAEESEPPGWDVEGIEAGDYPSGALCLVPHNSDVTIHEVEVSSLSDKKRD